MDKEEIRNRMKALRSRLSEAERDSAEGEAFGRLRSSGLLSGVRTVCLYESFGSELRTSRLKNALLADHIRVCVPVTRQEIELSEVRADTLSRTGKFGIAEPADFLPVDRQSVDCFVVPALAFDREGYRVGFGKGYYDRFLAGYRGIKIGYCYDFQLLERVPRGPYDVSVDYVATDRRIFAVKVKKV